MKFLPLFLIAAFAATVSAHAGMVDDIDAIEQQIDNIDLDQSKDDIQSDIDDIKAALEDLKGGSETVYVTPPKWNPNAQSLQNYLPKARPTPSHSPKTKIQGGHKYIWTQSDNPQIGWHWLQVN
jgi:F plasmid transfer operon protein TraF